MIRKPTYEELELSIEKLSRLEERYTLLINNIPDIIWLTDIEGNTSFISSNVEKIYGYTPNEIYKAGSKLFFERIHPEDIKQVRKAYSDFFERGAPFEQEYRIKHKKGHWIWLFDRALKIFDDQDQKLAFGVFNDITKRKETEALINVNASKYQDLYDNAPDMFLSIDFKTATIIECNQTLVDTLGYSDKTKILNRSVFDLYAPESAEYARNTIFQSFIETGKIRNEELRIRKKDGSIIDISVNATAVRNREGKILHTRSVWRDITQWKKIENALRKERNMSQLYLDVANVMLIAINAQGIVELINRKGCEILGYHQNEIIGKNWFDHFIPERFRNKIKNVFKKLMSDKTEIVEFFENPVLTKSGSEKIIAWHNTILTDEKGRITGTLSSGNDITLSKEMEEEKSKLEHQLIHTQKMEAIGTLAGGIAHDFNNLLMGVLGNISMMLADTSPSHPFHSNLSEIDNYIKSAVNLTKQLLGFARSGKYEMRSTNINSLIKEHNRMFGRTKKEITIRGTYEPKVWNTEVDSDQIKQVLMNIYVNACQATADRGEISILTENVKLDKEYVQPFELKYGKYVKLSITDTGTGMDKDTMERIFDPFFTTKEKERGTGMGLASAYGIIKNHGGFITVYSEVGQGATFNIYLPASKKRVKKEKDTTERVITGSGTVLLIDDEAMILNVGERMIKKLGYDVIIASGGKEGIDAYKKNLEKIDIVILDMIMPDISGGEAFDHLKEINPNVCTLLSSGYSIDGKATKILNKGCSGFIQKPFTMSQLSQKISDLVNKK